MTTGHEVAQRILSDIGATPDKDVADIVGEHLPAPTRRTRYPFSGTVDTISVQGVRSFGAEQTLELSRRLTVVYAENGTGKTSLVDAVELLTTGRTTRRVAFPEITTEVSDEDHIPHAAPGGGPVFPARVTATWRPSPDADPVVTTWHAEWETPAPEAPPLHALARRRLREIINSKAADRGERLGYAVGLGYYIKTYTAVREALTTETKRASPTVPDDISAAVSEWRFPTAATITLAELTDRIRAQARADISALCGETPDQEDRSDEVAALDEPITAPPRPQSARLRELADEWESLRTRLSNAESDRDDVELRLLSTFREVAAEGDRCVACDHGVVTAERLGVIDGILHGAAERKQLVDENDSLHRRAIRSLDEVDRHVEWRFTEPAPSSDPGPGTEATVFRERCAEVAALSRRWCDTVARLRTERPADPGPGSLRMIADRLDELASLHPSVDRAIGEAEHARREALSAVRSADVGEPRRRLAHAERIAHAVLTRRDHDRYTERCKKAGERVKSKLDALIAARFGEFRDDIDGWLKRLAPAGVPEIRIKAKPTAGRTALDLLVGDTVKAVGRLSDSQLDMLGLAAHLATLEREAPGAPLMIDDPTDMLDQSTRDRFVTEGIDSLLDGADQQRRQIVVLTHDHELVKTLWKRYGNQVPATVQYHIELDRDTTPPRSMIKPRTAVQHVHRVKELLHSYGNERHRLWLRSAAGNQARQALEMIVNGILETLGPRGHRHFENEPREEVEQRKGINSLFDLVEVELNEYDKTLRDCDDRTHREAKKRIPILRDALAERNDYLINEASHADFVYPDVKRITDFTNTLECLARYLEPARKNGRVDDLPKGSKWYEFFAGCDGHTRGPGSGNALP